MNDLGAIGNKRAMPLETRKLPLTTGVQLLSGCRGKVMERAVGKDVWQEPCLPRDYRMLDKIRVGVTKAYQEICE